jgi:hypothetical protein
MIYRHAQASQGGEDYSRRCNVMRQSRKFCAYARTQGWYAQHVMSNVIACVDSDAALVSSFATGWYDQQFLGDQTRNIHYLVCILFFGNPVISG